MTSAIETGVGYCGLAGPAIDRALALYPAEVARRVSQLLRTIRSGYPGRQHKSRLTGDGFPFELNFSEEDPDALRFTVDLANGPFSGCADADARAELAHARRWLGRSGLIDNGTSSWSESGIWSDLARMQREGPLTYGAWIGIRQVDTTTHAKVYVEVPPGAHLPSFCPAGPEWADESPVPRMIAYTPATGAFESYFRVGALESQHVAAVLAKVNLDKHASSFVEILEQAAGRRLRSKLPGKSIGISYSVDPSDRSVTFYFFARSIWGGDARIRQGFSCLSGDYGINAQRYLEVTAPLEGRDTWNTFHGLVGFKISVAGAPIATSIGIRPIEPDVCS